MLNLWKRKAKLLAAAICISLAGAAGVPALAEDSGFLPPAAFRSQRRHAGLCENGGSRAGYLFF